MITGKNYIGSQLKASGNSTLKTFNPLLNIENPWVFTEATQEEIEEVVALAHHAFCSYKRCSGVEKARFLNTIADEILALGDELLVQYCSESGFPKGRAEGERGRMIGQLRSFAEMLVEGSWVQATIDTAIPERQPAPKEDLRKMLVPLGPVVVFGSSNFPFAFSTAGGDTASALAAGCPVIVKSHSMHIGTGEMVASAIIKAAQKTNMPEGVFSNLTGGGRTLGASLVKHPLVKAVGFTGSISGGRALCDLAAQRPEPIPVFAEMGSVNPVVLLPEALKQNSQKWANAYAGSITLGAGQFCTNPGLLLAVKGAALNEFAEELTKAIEKTAPSCMLHASMQADFEKGILKMESQKGVSKVAQFKEEVPPNHGRATVLKVSGEEFLKNKVLSHEVFGPFSILVACNDEAELLQIINTLEGQLTGTIIGEEKELHHHQGLIFALQNRVGRLIFNGVPTGVEVCPSMLHGGPYPASSDSRFTAVGTHAVYRWVRPLSYQNWPDDLLPAELQNENPLQIVRTKDHKLTLSKI
ncbi:aldehyde dehydrogenase family protein [Flavobacterium sp. LC2016-23]|uniref:aldehyde dehydrogenase (NADP(+)) n=1 Tax=Flavobacterium sp. LC2016-23 TaxID=2666330 RepID=UPI0012B0ADBA|nr:aldehyde dehydrogenase (NADP(+)) [Flavobacterium sp. LC2016-23]MRX42008.1 aldehyde dehydrogenase family protein [Flavobacterium sp. LC2016-23]